MKSIALLFNYIATIANRIENARSANSTLLLSLFTWLPVTEKSIQFDDVEAMLSDLHCIDGLIDITIVDDILLQQQRILIHTFFKEIKRLIVKNPGFLSEQVYQKWKLANPSLSTHLYDYLLDSSSGNVECASPSAFEEKLENSKAFNLVCRVAIRWSLRVGHRPSLHWYHANEQLQAYKTQESLINLAYVDDKAFQELNFLFPGYFSHLIQSYNELHLFCQLAPKTCYQLMRIQQMQQYIPTVLHVLNIVERIADLPFESRIKIVKQFVKNLEDLIAVIDFNPAYVFLLINEIKNPVAKKKAISESSLMSLIKTKEDLLRFNLSNYYFHKVISISQRLLDLTANNQRYVEETYNSLHLPIQIRELHRNAARYYKFFGNKTQQLELPFLDSRLLTLGQLVALTQFHENAGYYTNGNIHIGNKDNEGHFITQASSGYGLAMALAHRAMEIWSQVPDSKRDYFEILECGAGDGSLCYKMLHFIDEMTRIYPQWVPFYKALHYTIVELSPVLLEQQQQKLAASKHGNKVEFILDDALKLSKYPRKADLHISNELMDMFQSEQIVMRENNQLFVVMSIPVLTYEAYHYLCSFAPRSVRGLQEESAVFTRDLQEHGMVLNLYGYYLIAQRFKTLLTATNDKSYKGPVHCFNFYEFTYPITYFPELSRFVENHDEILTNMQINDMKIISPSLEQYAKLITEKSMVSIMIDYGEVTFYLKNRSYRSFCSSRQFKYLFLFAPGKQDVTYCVDFSVLVESIIKYAPHALPTLINVGDLLPQNPKMPLWYMSQFTREMEKKFRDDNYSCTIYVNPDNAIKFNGIVERARTHSRQHRFFADIKKLASDNSTADKPRYLRANF